MHRTAYHCWPLIALLLAGCGGKPSHTAEEMARLTFAALQASDRGAYLDLGPSTGDIEDLFEAMVFANAQEERYMLNRRKKAGGAPGTQGSIRQMLFANFDEVLERSGKDFDWKKAVFGEVVRVEKSVRWGIASEDIFFTVAAEDGALYRFRLDDCVVLEDRRFLTDKLSYSGPTK